MEKSNKQKTSPKKDALKDVSGGYVKMVDKNTLGVYDNTTNQLILSAKLSGNEEDNRLIFQELTNADIAYHNGKR